MKDRREFISTCAAGAAVFLAPGGLLAADVTAAAIKAPAGPRLSKATFEALVHEGFRCMTGQGHAVKLELVEVWDGPRVRGLDQFGLLLRDTHGAGSSDLPGGLYRLYHPRTGVVRVRLDRSHSVPSAYSTHFGLFT